MNTDLHFSSKSSEWETPQDFFDQLNKKWNFDIDLCATKKNTKCKEFLTDIFKPNDFVGKRCFMNPPYGRGIGKFINAAYEISQWSNMVVCLLPARTDTKWFHVSVLNYGRIHFIRGRLKFELDGKPILDKNGRPQSAPFPSMLVTF